MEFINFLIETKQQQRFLSTNYVSHMIVRKQKRLPSEYVGWASIEDLPNSPSNRACYNIESCRDYNPYSS